MTLVMAMDFVVKAGVCAHLNITTKRTAPFMDVSSDGQKPGFFQNPGSQ